MVLRGNNFESGACFIEGKRVVFIKEVSYDFVKKVIEEGSAWEILPSETELINYRNKCIEEFSKFHGFTENDKKQIVFHEAKAIAKKCWEIYRFSNFINSL